MEIVHSKSVEKLGNNSLENQLAKESWINCIESTNNILLQPILRVVARHASRSSYRIRREISTWNKHGYLCVASPDMVVRIKLSIFMDIEVNPGPQGANSEVNLKFLDMPRKGLKIMHLNVQSLGNKLDQTKLILQINNIDILVLTETWSNNSWPDSLVAIPEYKCYRRD